MITINDKLTCLARQEFNDTQTYGWLLKNDANDDVLQLLDFAGAVTHKTLLDLQAQHRQLQPFFDELEKQSSALVEPIERYIVVSVDKISAGVKAVCLEHELTGQRRLLIVIQSRITQRKLKMIKVKNFNNLKLKRENGPDMRKFEFALGEVLLRRFGEAYKNDSYVKLAEEVNRKYRELLTLALQFSTKQDIFESDYIRLCQHFLHFFRRNGKFDTDDDIDETLRYELEAIANGNIPASYITESDVRFAKERWVNLLEKETEAGIKMKEAFPHMSKTPFLYHWWCGERPVEEVIRYYLNHDKTAPVDDDFEFQSVAHVINNFSLMSSGMPSLIPPKIADDFSDVLDDLAENEQVRVRAFIRYVDDYDQAMIDIQLILDNHGGRVLQNKTNHDAAIFEANNEAIEAVARLDTIKRIILLL